MPAATLKPSADTASEAKPAIPQKPASTTAPTLPISNKPESPATIRIPNETVEAQAPAPAKLGTNASESSPEATSSSSTLPGASSPITPADSDNNSGSAPILKAKPSSGGENGEVQPMKLKAPGLSDTDAPLLRPVSTSTLVDGKIVINKPAESNGAEE